MHYYQNPELENPTDQSGYAFVTTDKVDHSAMMLPFGLHNFTIPAGDSSYTTSDTFSLPLGFTIWGIFPHMHVLGSAYEFAAIDGDEKVCLRKKGLTYCKQNV